MQTRVDSDAEVGVPRSSPCNTASAPTFATASAIALPLAWLAPITMATRFSRAPQWSRSAITPGPASHSLSACRMLGRVRIIQYLCPQDKPEVMAARDELSSAGGRAVIVRAVIHHSRTRRTRYCENSTVGDDAINVDKGVSFVVYDEITTVSMPCRPPGSEKGRSYWHRESFINCGLFQYLYHHRQQIARPRWLEKPREPLGYERAPTIRH